MESYKDLKAEWYSVLTQLWDAYGKEVNKKQLSLYAEKLGDVPLGILERVVDAVIARHTFNSVPTLGEIQDVLMEMHPYYKDDFWVQTTPFADAYAREKRERQAAAL